MENISCIFLIIIQIFAAIFFQREHSPLLSHGMGHFFFIHARVLYTDTESWWDFCKLEMYLVFPSKWKWFCPRDNPGYPCRSGKNSHCKSCCSLNYCIFNLFWNREWGTKINRVFNPCNDILLAPTTHQNIICLNTHMPKKHN